MTNIINIGTVSVRAAGDRSHYEGILSALETGIVVVDCDGTVVFIDSSGTVAWSATPEELRMIAVAVIADPRVSNSAAARLELLRRVTTGTSPASYPGTLSRREQEILALICSGLDNFEIAEKLGVSPNTIRNHVASLYRKLRINRRSAAVIWAYERGFAKAEDRAATNGHGSD